MFIFPDHLMFFLSVTSYPLARSSAEKQGTPAFSKTAFLIPRTALLGDKVVVSLRNCFTFPCNS